MPGYLVQRAEAYGICLCEVYGSTESVPHAFVRPCEALKLGGASSGRAVEGVEIRVVDENGKDVPAKRRGKNGPRGPNVFVGYLKDRATTDGVLDDEGWFHSGDLCVMDENQNIRIIGRKKDMIVRGGENLNTNEINDAWRAAPEWATMLLSECRTTVWESASALLRFPVPEHRSCVWKMSFPTSKKSGCQSVSGRSMYSYVRLSIRSMYSYVRLSIDRCTATYV